MSEYKFDKHKIYTMDCKTLEKKWVLEIYDKKYVVNEDVYKFIKKYQTVLLNEACLTETEQQVFGLLKDVGYFSDKCDIKSSGNRDYARLIFKKKIFSAKVLKHLKIFSFLFSKIFVIPILFLILLSIAYVLFSFKNAEKSNCNVIFVLTLLLCSTTFHEIGHISASIKYGVVPRWAGLGIYFTSIIAFVDVDNTWKLPQKQRLVVDIGGIYFQFIAVCVYSLLYLILKQFVFLQTAYLLIISAIFNLNPFLKYDGYWVFSDMLGVYNLNQRIGASIQKLFHKKSFCVKNENSNDISNKKNVIISIYSLISVVFFIYFGIALFKSSIFSMLGLFNNFSLYRLFVSLLLLYFSTMSIISLFKMLKDIF